MWRLRTRSRTPRLSCSSWWRGMMACSLLIYIHSATQPSHMNILHATDCLCLCQGCSPPAAVFLCTLSYKHCTNKTSDCNQGKCQHVWEPHCSCPWASLINLVLRIAKTLFGWQGVYHYKAFPLSQACSWLALWLKVLPKFSFLATVAPCHSFFFFLSSFSVTQAHTH